MMSRMVEALRRIEDRAGTSPAPEAPIDTPSAVAVIDDEAATTDTESAAADETPDVAVPVPTADPVPAPVAATAAEAEATPEDVADETKPTPEESPLGDPSAPTNGAQTERPDSVNVDNSIDDGGSRSGAAAPHLPSATRTDSHRARHASDVDTICANLAALATPGASTVMVFAAADESVDHAEVVQRVARGLAERLDDPVLLVQLSAEEHGPPTTAASANEPVDPPQADSTWRERMVQTETPGLCLVRAPDTGSDGRSEADLTQLITEAKQDYSTVLLDAGLLDARLLEGKLPAGEIADAPRHPPSLAATDGAILLVRLGGTGRDEARSAAQRLSALGVQLLGCLLVE